MRPNPYASLASPKNPLLLDAAAIASLTKGRWFNVSSDAAFSGISFSQTDMAKGLSGDLYFTAELKPQSDSFHADTLGAARNALKDGAQAVVVSKTVPNLPDDWPLLKVDNVNEALDRLAFHVRDHVFAGKRVLVSGSRGSNDFKNMLWHVLTPQMSTHALRADADTGFAIVSSLASIRQQDQVAVIEASARPAGRLAVRSGYVQPHLAVLTDISTNSRAKTATPQEINAYADIATELVDGGYCLINADNPDCQRLQQSILARRRVPLVLFGSAAHCPGRLLEQRFSDKQWWVTATIEGQSLDYRLPLVDAAAPLLSVAVLLTAYYLGADVARAAAALANFTPYRPNQELCDITCHGGLAHLYQNQSPANSADLEAFFQTSAHVKPPAPLGRKLLVLGAASSEFVMPSYTTLALWIDKADADAVVLAGAQAAASIDLLQHPERVVKRFPDLGRRHNSPAPLEPLLDTVRDLVRPGDLVLIGGDMPEVAEHLRQIGPSTPTPKLPVQALQPTTAPAGDGNTHNPAPYFKDKNGIRSMQLGSTVRQSVMRLDQPNTILWEFHEHMMGWLLFVDPDSVAQRHAMQLGLGGGCLTKACHQTLGMKTTAVELYPAVIALCGASFYLPPDDAKLQVIPDDALHQLRQPKWQGTVDALQVDLFDDRVLAPVFDSEDFFADCRAVLTKDGCITFNSVGRKSNVRQTLQNMGRVFGESGVWSFTRSDTGNTVVMAQRLPSRPSLRTLTLRAQEIERRWGFPATQWVDSLQSWVA